MAVSAAVDFPPVMAEHSVSCHSSQAPDYQWIIWDEWLLLGLCEYWLWQLTRHHFGDHVCTHLTAEVQDYGDEYLFSRLFSIASVFKGKAGCRCLLLPPGYTGAPFYLVMNEP